MCVGGSSLTPQVIQRSRFSASLIGLGFALFVSLHPQPNTMGTLIHRACGAMLVVYAAARLCSRFDGKAPRRPCDSSSIAPHGHVGASMLAL